MVILPGDPVAVAQETAGRKLSRGEKDSVKNQRKNEQDAIKSQIVAAGGTILGSLQSAINGIKVSIPRNKVSALRNIAGVDVKPINRYDRQNTIGVPRVQAPAVWSGVFGLHGEGIKIAVIDTGIDYTHANFKGPGTVAAYQAAKAAGAQPANPALFGPNAPRVKGGYDFVGDDYDANPDNDTYQPVPHPDPNPLDCDLDVGHGSHVAGTAAGSGVLSTGLTYNGTYDSSTYSNSFRIGPGVAPKADLYALRVFGCFGSTDIVVDAIDWAVDNDMDVINMSLGSAYGEADDADSIASDNAVKAGVMVVASAGNSNDLRYITGSPGASTRTLSVAATTTPDVIRSANLALPPAGADGARTLNAINANGANYTSPLTGLVKVVRDPAQAGGVSLGCSTAAFQANGGVAGKIAVVQRGVCARVAKAIYGQQAGAIAVVMINNSTAQPPYEGTIFQNPDDGVYYDVTIPFLGVRGLASTATSEGGRLIARDGLSVSITEGPSSISGLASFSSGGPRNGDSVLKPEISAPGSPIISTYSGSGNRQESLSGTSMASPHVAGIAALVLQAHPKWKPKDIKAAIMNSGNPAQINPYITHSAGTGFVNAAQAARTQVTASADDKTVSASFGMIEIKDDFSQDVTIKLHNDGTTDATFNVSVTNPQGSPHTVSFNKTQVKVKKGADENVKVTLNVPVATAGNSDAFRDVAGLVTFTPVSASDNFGLTLRVPYYLVPRVQTNVEAKLDKDIRYTSPTGTVNLTNKKGPITATADFYSWGLNGKGKGSDPKNDLVNVSAAGVQSFGDGSMAFAITAEQGWSAPNLIEFDVYVDTTGDGVPDFVVVGVDFGLINGTNTFDGRMVSAVFDLATGDGFVDFLANAPTDSSTIVLPLLKERLGLTAANPRIEYTVTAGSVFTGGPSDSFANSAKYNAFASAISDGQFTTVAPNGNVAVPVSVNLNEYAVTPPLGLMVVTQDNQNGKSEASLVEIKLKK